MSAVPRAVSVAPMWIGAAIGVLLGLLHPSGVIVTAPLGFVIGYLMYAREQARVQHRELTGGIGDLLERVSLLEYSVKWLRAGDDRALAAEAEAAPFQTDDEASDVPIAFVAPEFESVRAVSPTAPAETAFSAGVTEPRARPADFAAATPDPKPRAAIPSFLSHAITVAKAWLFGGNTVARVGLLVLFVGVAFLLRYVAERTQVPIELRLVGVALGAIALLVLGWRLRHKRIGYAITLQGGAIGILYLTVFAALRLYDVLPAVPAFVLLALLAVFSGVLAVAQNARALAALGAAGGFLAPILVSTGSGRIEILLSYYLLLNFGVLGIAWFRAWRELNWIGFAFTFAVMGMWVAQRYSPDQYVVAQGFLIAFWVLFLAVALLYALRQPQATRGIFDTTLMFALPLAAFGIQSRLTSGVQLALSSAIAAGAYLASSSVLIKRRDAALQVLIEASFGVGVAFLTLAVPLAASAQWTAAAWAVEGLALLWVGLRQRRGLPIAAGLVLHGAATLALVRALSTGVITTAPQFSGFTLNLVVSVATAFAASILLSRSVADKRAFGRIGVLLVDGLPWTMRLIAWAWVVVLVWQPVPYPTYVFAWCALSLALMVLNQKWLRPRAAEALPPEWVAGAAVAVFAWVATEAHFAQAVDSQTTLLRLTVAGTAVIAALLSLSGGKNQRNAAAGLLALGVFVWLVALLAETWKRVDEPLAVTQIGLLVVTLTAATLIGLAQRVRWTWPLQLSWLQFAVHLLFAAAIVLWAIIDAELPSAFFGWIAWPVAWGFFYLRLAYNDRTLLPAPPSLLSVLHVGGLWLLIGMVAAEVSLRVDMIAADGWFHAVWGVVPAIALWLVVACAMRWPMRAAPFAYAKVGAPGLAIFLLAWLVLTSIWVPGDAAPVPYLPLLNPLDVASLIALAALLRWHMTDHRVQWQRVSRVALGIIAFIALNAAALRAVHFLADVAWTADALASSRVVQAVLSLLWTATAMGLMVLANRRGMRGWWLLGAALLAAVVLKLFFVDLSAQGTIERIVSFVGVGLLILLIGYLAPVPPSAPKSASVPA
ncbi:MAG: DUF2339 domain-containing protein [Burkholderiaceae bacterium]